MKFVQIFLSAIVGLTSAHRTVEDPDEILLNRDHEVSDTLEKHDPIVEKLESYPLLQKFSDEREQT